MKHPSPHAGLPSLHTIGGPETQVTPQLPVPMQFTMQSFSQVISHAPTRLQVIVLPLPAVTRHVAASSQRYRHDSPHVASQELTFEQLTSASAAAFTAQSVARRQS